MQQPKRSDYLSDWQWREAMRKWASMPTDIAGELDMEPAPATVVRNIDAAKLAHANGEGDGRELDGVK